MTRQFGMDGRRTPDRFRRRALPVVQSSRSRVLKALNTD